jgi:hypothetical protein
MDYFYLTSEGVNGWSEMLKFLELEDDARGHARVQQLMDDKEIVKCLIVCDYTSKAVFATVIGQKGHDDEEYSVNFILEAIKWLGYSTIIVKSDNEPAMLKLVKVAVQRLRVSLETVREEHSKEYDSKAHGGTETRIRSVRMLFRTLRSYLESQIGKKIPIFHPILAWLLSYTATLQNIVARGSDGRTPWSTIKGRPFNGRLAAFGEMCRWKLPTKGPAARNRGNMEVQNEEGIFLGINWNVNEYLYATAEGIQGSRSLTRVPFEQRWSLEAISAVAATPWQLKVPRDPEVIFPQDVPKEAPPRREILPVRRLKIMADDLHKHGLTHGCPYCDYVRENGQARPGMAHSEACRDRILTAIAATPEGMERIQKVEDRASNAIARYIEKNDPTAAAPDMTGLPDGPHPPPPLQPSGSGDPDDLFYPDGDQQMEDNVDSYDPDYVPPASSEMDIGNIELTTQKADGSTEGWCPRADEAAMPKPQEGSSMAVIPDGGKGVPTASRSSSMSTLRRTDEPSHDDEVLSLVMALGGDKRAYCRERSTRLKATISEIYSPPRVTAALRGMPSLGLIPGFALDLTVIDEYDNEPWDFDRLDKRERARKLVKEQKPMLLIGSPMCRAFSTWQALNQTKSRDPDKYRRARVQAELHIRFVCELYELQIEGQRYFLHEHPAGATSWKLPCIDRVTQQPGVTIVRGDQCQYGAEAGDDPVNKPTRFMTNALQLAKALSKTCEGRKGFCSRPKGGQHRWCSGKVAADAAIYPLQLCRAILRGSLSAQARRILRREVLWINGSEYQRSCSHVTEGRQLCAGQ